MHCQTRHTRSLSHTDQIGLDPPPNTGAAMPSPGEAAPCKMQNALCSLPTAQPCVPSHIHDSNNTDMGSMTTSSKVTGRLRIEEADARNRMSDLVASSILAFAI